MITVTQNRTIICDANGVHASACPRSGDAGRSPAYNPGMNKPTSRRNARRTAWWVAFAALAGFLLADLT
ncbi:hypothetical protein CupriaWKF_14710 [Cupriavidus sp. WKF15]|uniref:hypothetical protein n=1 Tax=Cupriavidus sp. WKF15 TaxID=3032282 RepID=UPI0023E1F142|nr:hypothetical protein [Cupriavidus sp. WKF15]WER45538.1 hypothetical protein CupriaWKF_14710 [Cupriavidus sp. WKF15]